jgi:N-acetylmuramoyl-L-alanine amidase/Fibronectin type III domain
MERKFLKRMRLEQLEDRLAMAADPLVPVGQQPQGGLSDKIVYVHSGHGYVADNLGSGAWSTQRGETFEIVEDFGNQDQATAYANFLFNAGATVVPLRPIGHQPREVVMDNDEPGVTFVGGWSNSSSTVYYGSPGDVRFRFATTSPTQTAYARYQPNIPASGFYPVYAWSPSGSNRAADQLYRVQHSGGITEVTINHRRVGNGLVYLGTYYFEQGSTGYVDISNRSNEAGRIVVADMIRFGNGLGDINRGGGISGRTREDESGLYWIQWHVDRAQGISSTEYRASSDDGAAVVSFSPRYAEYMNVATDGSLSDRAFVSFHSNAGGGTSRGVLGLFNGNNDPATRTPNQFLLASRLAQELNDDLVAQNGQYEHNWQSRTTVTLDRSDIEFGEINNLYINNEFDATIVEVAFHDNQQDAELMRDPRVRDAAARASYQGLVKYFNAVDGGATSLTMAPGAVSTVRAVTLAPGSIQVAWAPPAANSYNGDSPQGYRIYASNNGYGFDGGTLVTGANQTSYTFNGLDSNAGPYYFKVVAWNAGGESPGSEVVAANPAVGPSKILVVNGFDRLERRLNPLQSYGGGTVDRVRPRNSNSADYVVQVAEAIEAHNASLVVDSASNEAILNGSVVLSSYDAVIWILGEESTENDTFNLNEQTLVANYLTGGGQLFLSGAEIGWDLDQQNNGRAFYNSILRADYVADDANTYNVSGITGSIFAGLNFTFDNGSQFYDVTFPDVLAPSAGSTAALSYSGGTGGTAGIIYDGGSAGPKIVNFGFPFETITSLPLRNQVLDRVLSFFDLTTAPDADFNDDGFLNCFDIDALVAEIALGTNTPALDLTLDGLVNMADLTAWLAAAGSMNLGAGRAYLPGDATLDGAVDGSDFGIWNANKFTLGRAWCSGDFNADGVADGSDFAIWNSNKFLSSDGTSRRASRPHDPELTRHDHLAALPVLSREEETGKVRRKRTPYGSRG